MSIQKRHLLASISSCHMLTFIWPAAKERFVIDSYEDPRNR